MLHYFIFIFYLGGFKNFRAGYALKTQPWFPHLSQYALKHIYSYLHIFNRANNSTTNKRGRKEIHNIV